MVHSERRSAKFTVRLAVSVAAVSAASAAIFSLGSSQPHRDTLAEAGLQGPAAAPGRLGPLSRSVGIGHASHPLAPTKNADTQVTVGSIPLTLAPGWRVAKQEDKYVGVLNKRKDAVFTVEENDFDSGTSVEEAMGLFYRSMTREMTNTSHTPSYDPGFVGKRFTESAAVGYHGDLATDKGTMKVVGVLVVLLNPKTGNSALVKLASEEPEVLMENVDDANSMTTSMVD